ncbi:MAG: tetratricopeptide (TPR) repeat protein, partial [Myxococcota bacterium]
GGEPAPLVTLATQLPALGVGVDPALRIVAAVRKRPLVLVVDDLEQMKRGQLQRLTGLVRDLVAVEGERLLVIASVTEEDGGPVAGFVSGAATGLSPERLPLSGLDRRSTIALVREQGVTGAAGAALGHRLHEELRGQPGATIDQITALVTAGWLVAGEGGLRSTRGIDQLREAPLPIPPHVRDQQEGVLARVSPHARALLEVMVVLNMEGTAALIRRILDQPASQVDRAAMELAAAGFIQRRLEGTAEVLSLHPTQQRGLLYALIKPQRRAALHRQVAATLRSRSRRLGQMAEIIGHHLLQGGQIAEAWPLLLVAAQGKLRSGRLKTARQLLRLALDAQPAAEAVLPLDEVQRHRRLLFALEAESRERGGDLTGAVVAWEQALDAAQEEGDPKTVARIQSGLGLAQTARGDVMLANVGLEEAITHLERGDPMWPRVARALAGARLEAGAVEGAEHLWGELLELSRATDSSARRAEALAGLGQIALARGDVAAGQQLLEEALPALSSHQPDPEHARLLLSAAELSLCAGQLHRARQHAERAESIARDAQRLMVCVRALGVSACAAWALGDEGEASRAVRSAGALMQAVSETETAEDLRARLLMARVLAMQGSLARARAMLPEAVADIEPGLDDPAAQQQALLSRLLAGQQPGRAIELARAVLERTPARLPWVAARIALDTAHALRTMERITAARMALSRVDALVGQGPLRLLGLEAARLRAALTQGRDGVEEAAALRDRLYRDLGEPVGFWSRWS